MNFLNAALALVVLALTAPLVLWAERRAKAWTQLRRGPSILQPYRDLRKLFSKHPLIPDTASPPYVWTAPLCFAVVATAATLVPVQAATAAPLGGLGLLVIALLFTLHRFLLAAQAYDTATAFGGLGSSRELFLGGLAEPVFLLGAAGVFLLTGTADLPSAPLPWAQPGAWLVVAAFVLLWVAESARIPFDNPATHLELTMVHEAMILEASGWVLAFHEWASALKQTVLGAVFVLLLVPLPSTGIGRALLLAFLIVLGSSIVALVESAAAKVRLFRASHLLIMAALLAFLGGAVTLLGATAA